MPTTPLHVLHLDDELLVLDTVRDALAREMVVDRAMSLASAREALAINSYDILLVDLMLGDSHGVGTIKALRPYGLPMVVLSCVDDPEVLEAAAEAGADDYITKGVMNGTHLSSRLRFAHNRFLKRRQYEEQETARRAAQRKRYLQGATFEALKPFISCAGVAAGSRTPFVGA